MNHECFKCNRLIDKITNEDDKEDVGQFIYICEECSMDKRRAYEQLT